MAGVKGRSGGARVNTGGARPGAGRPRKNPEFSVGGDRLNKSRAKAFKLDPPATSGAPSETPVQTTYNKALTYLMYVVNDPETDPRLRVRAAVAAAQYQQVKAGDGGKREGQADAAKKAGGGKFAPAAPPLKLVGAQ